MPPTRGFNSIGPWVEKLCDRSLYTSSLVWEGSSMKAQSNLKTTRSRRDTVHSVDRSQGDQPPGLTHGAVRSFDGRASGNIIRQQPQQ